MDTVDNREKSRGKEKKRSKCVVENRWVFPRKKQRIIYITGFNIMFTLVFTGKSGKNNAFYSFPFMFAVISFTTVFRCVLPGRFVSILSTEWITVV